MSYHEAFTDVSELQAIDVGVVNWIQKNIWALKDARLYKKNLVQVSIFSLQLVK